MPTQNINLSKEARRRFWSHKITCATTTLQANAFVNYLNDIKITAIWFVYAVASDAGAVQPIEVGTAADPDHYLTASPTASQAIGTVENKTLLSSDLLPAGTPLFIRRANTTAGANTADVNVVVAYEIQDKDPSGGR